MLEKRAVPFVDPVRYLISLSEEQASSSNGHILPAIRSFQPLEAGFAPKRRRVSVCRSFLPSLFLAYVHRPESFQIDVPLDEL